MIDWRLIIRKISNDRRILFINPVGKDELVEMMKLIWSKAKLDHFSINKHQCTGCGKYGDGGIYFLTIDLGNGVERYEMNNLWEHYLLEHRDTITEVDLKLIKRIYLKLI